MMQPPWSTCRRGRLSSRSLLLPASIFGRSRPCFQRKRPVLSLHLWTHSRVQPLNRGTKESVPSKKKFGAFTAGPLESKTISTIQTTTASWAILIRCSMMPGPTFAEFVQPQNGCHCWLCMKIETPNSILEKPGLCIFTFPKNISRRATSREFMPAFKQPSADLPARIITNSPPSSTAENHPVPARLPSACTHRSLSQ